MFFIIVQGDVWTVLKICFIKPMYSWKAKKKKANKIPSSLMLRKKLLIEEGEQDGLCRKGPVIVLPSLAT